MCELKKMGKQEKKHTQSFKVYERKSQCTGVNARWLLFLITSSRKENCIKWTTIFHSTLKLSGQYCCLSKGEWSGSKCKNIPNAFILMMKTYITRFWRLYLLFFFVCLFFFYQQYRSKRSHSPYFQIEKLLDCTVKKVLEKDSEVREGVVIGSFVSFQTGSDILSHKCFHSHKFFTSDHLKSLLTWLIIKLDIAI